MQITSNIMMVRPANFGPNPETAANNTFQEEVKENSLDDIRTSAVREFDTFVEILRSNGINVIVVQDGNDPAKPDAVFPNNWVSFHENGTVITYPMFSPKRRAERDESIIVMLDEAFEIRKRYSFEQYENEGLFLEGTGSLTLDRTNKIAYACHSPRTDIQLFDRWCVLTGFEREIFSAFDSDGHPIYHTNVMMTVGETFTVICMDSITDDKEKKSVMKRFLETNKALIEISMQQMMHFAGNMLQVRSNLGKTYLVMSEQAFGTLRPQQIREIEKHTDVLRAPLFTIEKYGGGSARCMMAEIFLPEKVNNQS